MSEVDDVRLLNRFERRREAHYPMRRPNNRSDFRGTSMRTSGSLEGTVLADVIVAEDRLARAVRFIHPQPQQEQRQ